MKTDFDNCWSLVKISSFVRLNMIFEGNNFMNVYYLRFLVQLGSIATLQIVFGWNIWLKKKYEFEYLHIEKKRFFSVISQKKELIKQNDGHFWI